MTNVRGIASGFVLLGLFALGVAHWVVFFNFGQMTFHGGDWTKDFIYHSILQEWITAGHLPLHFVPPLQDTSRFFAIPETILSPQIVLLRFLSIGQFVVVNTLVMYAVGFAGCLLIRRRYQLTLVSFATLFLLFNFNGHIVSHLAAGHSSWNGYFLLPFFTLYVLDLARPANTAGGNLDRTAAKLALVLFAMNLQGSFHLYVACVMFLGLVATFTFTRTCTRAVALAGAFSVFMSLFRILPGAITYWNIEHPFVTGYPTVTDLIAALITIKTPLSTPAPGLMGSVDWQEYDLFLGIFGLLVVGYWGVYARFKAMAGDQLKPFEFRSLDWPMGILSVVSFGAFYAVIARLPIPLVNSEAVSSRFLIVPFVMVLTLACVRLTHSAVLAGRIGLTWLFVAGLAQTGFELATHSWAWRVDAWTTMFPEWHGDFAYQLVQVSDPIYVNSLIGSLAVSGAALVSLMVWSARAPRTPQLEI